MQLAVILLCSLMHELGHISVMCLFGMPPEALTFYAGGIRLSDSCLYCGRAKTAAVLLAGCAVNLLCAGISLLLGYAGLFAAANLALGLFNLLPFRYFDGGRLYTELTGREPPALLRMAALLSAAALTVLSVIRGSIPFSLIATAVIILCDG